jgi:two-component system cell cycle sensor histidine kinase/response regulator CckA
MQGESPAPTRSSSSNASIARAMQAIDDAVIIADADNSIVFTNEAAAHAIGMTCEDAVGRPLLDVFKVSLFFEIAADARVTLTRRNGSVTQIEHSAAPIVADDGSPDGTIITFHDITERIRIDEDRALTERLTTVATIAAGISHELNNPVAMVESNVRFAREELGALAQKSPRVGDALADAVGALDDGLLGVERVKQIVKQMKIFLFADAGPAMVDVNEALRLAVRLLGQQLDACGGDVVEELADALPHVLCDEGQLVQCFMNILRNASQSFAGGGDARGTIRIRTRQEAPYIVVEIADDGAGIPECYLPRIFEPFFTTRAPGEGVGLGLSISRAIVMRAGGDISAHSASTTTSGSGTTLRVRLPFSI